MSVRLIDWSYQEKPSGVNFQIFLQVGSKPVDLDEQITPSREAAASEHLDYIFGSIFDAICKEAGCEIDSLHLTSSFSDSTWHVIVSDRMDCFHGRLITASDPCEGRSLFEAALMAIVNLVNKKLATHLPQVAHAA